MAIQTRILKVIPKQTAIDLGFQIKIRMGSQKDSCCQILKVTLITIHLDFLKPKD